MSSTAFEGKFIEFLDGAIQRSKRSADRAMVQFVVLRLMLVVASASLPALITIAGQNWSSVVDVLVAALTGLDTQFRWVAQQPTAEAVVPSPCGQCTSGML